MALPDVAPFPSPEVALHFVASRDLEKKRGAGDYTRILRVEGDAFSLLRDGGDLTHNQPRPTGEHCSPWHCLGSTDEQSP